MTQSSGESRGMGVSGEQALAAIRPAIAEHVLATFESIRGESDVRAVLHDDVLV